VAGEMRRRAVLSRDYGQVPPVRGDTPGLAQVFIQLLLQTAWAIPEGAPAGRALLVRTAWDEASGRVLVEIAGPAGAVASADEAASDDVGLKLAGEVVARLGGRLEAREVVGAGPGFSVALMPARPPGPAALC
jgi:two-component system, NtrC family, sensor kinase